MDKLINKIQNDYKGERLCQYYFSFLAQLKKSDDQKLLKAVISYHMKPSEQKPFDAFLILEGRRSPMPEDLSEDEVKKLVKSYKIINDPELKARFADVLWLKKKEIKYAHDAVVAYIESAKKLRNKSWTYSQDRIERALRLSLSLGKGGEKDIENVISCIQEILEKYELEKEAYFPLKLIELLLDINHDDNTFCISILENCIEFFIKEKDIYRLNDYLEALAQWHEKNDEVDKAKENRKQIAENHVESQDLESSAMGKAHCLQKAIEVYRRIGNHKKRIDELHKELIKIQKNIPSEMQTLSGGNIDISASVKASVKHVSNMSKREALIRFCFITKPTDIKHTFDYVEKQAQQFIHTSLFGRTTVNKDGKTVGHSAGLTNNELSREELLYPHLVDHMGLSWGLNSQGSIIPAKEQIILEHQIEESDLKEFIVNNPLIRNGHEALFAQGILFGFEGKWDLSLGILAIQIEDSLRYLLEKKGVLTSNIKSDFTQEERGVTYFFKNYSKELKEIFGEDVFYELRALLVKDDNGNGFNLRNLIAHGLMSQNEFYTSVCVYFWWLIFRLICTPAIISESKNNKKNEQKN